MRLALDCREVSVGRRGGLRTYAESITRCLAEHPGDLTVVAYLDRDGAEARLVTAGLSQRLCSPANLAVREQVTLPRMLARDGIDLAHFLSNTAPLFCPVPYVLTLHDTFCMERPLRSILTSGSLHNRGLSAYSKYIPYAAARRARKVITVSGYSAQRIAATTGISESDIAVVPQAVHSRYRRVDAGDLRSSMLARLGTERMVLAMGSLEPRKNTAGVLRAFDALLAARGDTGLLLTWPAGVDFGKWLSRHGLREPRQVEVISDVTDEDLVRLYSSADAFLFPSLDEGFGLPVVEAMACGCPVVTSSVSCLPETAGGAALLADPGDPNDVAGRLCELMDSPSLRDSLIQLGYDRSAALSAERAAGALVSVYYSVIAHDRPRQTLAG